MNYSPRNFHLSVHISKHWPSVTSTVRYLLTFEIFDLKKKKKKNDSLEILFFLLSGNASLMMIVIVVASRFSLNYFIQFPRFPAFRFDRTGGIEIIALRHTHPLYGKLISRSKMTMASKMVRRLFPFGNARFIDHYFIVG